MKKITALFLLLFICHYSNAQTVDTLTACHRQMLNFLFARQTFHTSVAEKTTGTQERLIGYSHMDGGLMPTRLIDTISFFYSSARGSAFDFNTMSYEYYYLPDLYKYPWFTKLRPFENNTASVAYDSFLEYRPTVGTAIGDTLTCYRKYFGMLPVYTAAQRFADTTINTDTLGYDSYGNVIFDFNVDKSPHMLDTNYCVYFTYDSKQRLIADSVTNKSVLGGMQPFYTLHYSYNSIGNLTEISNGYQLYEISYTSDNKIKTVVLDTGISKTPYQTDSFAYTSGVPYYTFTSDSLRSGSKWIFNTSSVKYVNADLVPDSMIEWNMSYPSLGKAKHIYTYTAKNNPVSDYVQVTDPSVSFVLLTTYYYETYTGINDISPIASSFQLYPNPATDILYVKQSGQQTGIAQLNVYDASGKLVLCKSIMLNNTIISIPISEWTSGIYFYNLQKDGMLLTSGKFIKQ